jgi:hypothetical protein
MSRSGRETLLKAVIQAIPTFLMSCFQIPVSICELLRKAIADHWWGIEEREKENALEKLGMVKHSEKVGGHGFSRPCPF